MTQQSDGPAQWSGRDLFDANAEKIGTIVGRGLAGKKFGTMWLLVETISGAQVLVPADQIRSSPVRLTLPYPRTYVESAPTGAPDRRLSPTEERRLCLHYGFDHELPGTECRQGCGLCRSRKKTGSPRSSASSRAAA